MTSSSKNILQPYVRVNTAPKMLEAFSLTFFTIFTNRDEQKL